MMLMTYQLYLMMSIVVTKVSVCPILRVLTPSKGRSKVAVHKWFGHEEVLKQSVFTIRMLTRKQITGLLARGKKAKDFN